jgi:hypothetical protein
VEALCLKPFFILLHNIKANESERIQFCKSVKKMGITFLPFNGLLFSTPIGNPIKEILLELNLR